MKKILSILMSLLLCITALTSFVACQKDAKPVDYVAMQKLDMSSSTLKAEVTVRTYIDGDTTHFNLPSEHVNAFSDGYCKARYLAIDTPESTGVIQEYGKQASNFTKETLSGAQSIILESDTSEWNFDGNNRGLVWVWYRKSASEDYRLLNLELLQNGLAYGKSLEDTKYAQICRSAYYQAMDKKIKLFSGEKDPLFYYDDATEISLKYLRTHTDEFAGKKVAFVATIAKVYNHYLYVQDLDIEDNMYYGMVIFYGYSCDFDYLFKPGARIRFVADATNNEPWGFQVQNLKYDPFITDPDLVKNYLTPISEDNEVVYPITDAEIFNGKKSVKVYNGADDEDGTLTEFDYARLVLNAPIAFEGLRVDHIYTTNNGGNSDGAMTIYCRDANNKEIILRTLVLYENDQANAAKTNKILASAYENKTINAKGIVDWYQPTDSDGHPKGDGQYQIEISSVFDIEVVS